MDRVQRRFCISTFAQQSHALDYRRIIDDGSIRLVICSCHCAQQDFWALLHLCYVFDSERRPFFCRQNGLLDVLHCGVKADKANIQLLRPFLNKTSSGIHVVACQLLLNLANAQAIRYELVRIDAHLVLACRAAEGGYVHNIRDRLELFFESPVLDRLQIH